MAHEILRLSEFTDTTPVLIPTVEQPIEMSVADVLRWVAPTAPPSEAMKFLMACRMAMVNPFLGEAHLVEHGGQFTTIIDKSGYLKRAQSDPRYDGHDAGIIVMPKGGGPATDVDGAFLPPGSILVGGWAIVHRKGSRPITVRVSLHEYNRGSATWKTLTCTMIRKVALVQCLRESGLISSGWYDAGEMPEHDAPSPYPTPHVVPGDPIDVEYRAVGDHSLAPDLAAELLSLMDRARMTEDQRSAALRRRGVSRLAELSNIAAHDMILNLRRVVDRDDPAPFEVADAPRRPGGPSSPVRSLAPPDSLDTHADADVNADANRELVTSEPETES